MSGLMKILFYAAIIYAAVVAIAYAAQRKLMYFPDATRIEPARIGLDGVREIVLPTPDDARIIAWYAPAPPGQPTLLYFHGNGGNLAGRAQRLARYQNAGLGVPSPGLQRQQRLGLLLRVVQRDHALDLLPVAE